MSDTFLDSNNNFFVEDSSQQQQLSSTQLGSEQKELKEMNLNQTSTAPPEKQVTEPQNDTSRLMNDRSLLKSKRAGMQSSYRLERIRESFKSLNVKEVAEEYVQQHVKVSALSIGQYIDMVNESNNSKIEPIHFLPPVVSNKLEQLSYKKDFFGSINTNNNILKNDRDFNNFGKRNDNSNFINEDEIRYINQNIVDLLDHSLQTTRQNWNRYNNTLFRSKPTSRSYQPSPRTRNNSLLSTLSNQIEKKQAIKMQLEHNKNQFEQAQQYNLNEISRRYKKEISITENFNRKIESLPRIRHYPSRGKIIENMMHMQMVRQIHQANEHRSDTQNSDSVQKNSHDKSQNLKVEVGFNLLSIQYRGYWLDTENTGWKPPSRETSRCAQYGDIAYLYGGIGMEVLSDFCGFNLKIKQWQQLPQRGEYPKEGRFGHSLDVYKKSLIMFGGEKKCSATSKLKELVNEVRILNLDTLEWKVQRCSGDQIEYRRDHASSIVGKNLIIHGGISQKNYCNDLFHLDLCNNQFDISFEFIQHSYHKINQTEFNRWTEANCINLQKCYPEGVAYHTAIPIYFSERKNLQLYKQLEDRHADKFNRLKEEGIYFFGGISQSGITNNTLAILKTDRRPMQFIIPETLGQPPQSRCKHSMVFQEQLEWIVIYGGTNEGHSHVGYLNDMHMLKLDTLIWRQITFYGLDKIGRCGHLSLSHGTQVLILGGLGDQGIYSLGSVEAELEQKSVLRYAQDEIKQVEIKNKRKQNTSIDRNLIGNISKIKQDLNQSEQAMEYQIKIMESHKESVARLLKKLQFKSQNSFLPLPNQMNDLSHMNSLLVYQNATGLDSEHLKKKDEINKQAEQFNKEDDTLNENLKLTQENFHKGERTPQKNISNLRQRVKTLMNVKKLVDLKSISSSRLIEQSPLTLQSAPLKYTNSILLDQLSPNKQLDLQAGIQSPLTSVLSKDANFSQRAQQLIQRSLIKSRTVKKESNGQSETLIQENPA